MTEYFGEEHDEATPGPSAAAGARYALSPHRMMGSAMGSEQTVPAELAGSGPVPGRGHLHDELRSRVIEKKSLLAPPRDYDGASQRLGGTSPEPGSQRASARAAVQVSAAAASAPGRNVDFPLRGQGSCGNQQVRCVA